MVLATLSARRICSRALQEQTGFHGIFSRVLVYLDTFGSHGRAKLLHGIPGIDDETGSKGRPFRVFERQIPRKCQHTTVLQPTMGRYRDHLPRCRDRLLRRGRIWRRFCHGGHPLRRLRRSNSSQVFCFSVDGKGDDSVRYVSIGVFYVF